VTSMDRARTTCFVLAFSIAGCQTSRQAGITACVSFGIAAIAGGIGGQTKSSEVTPATLGAVYIGGTAALVGMISGIAWLAMDDGVDPGPGSGSAQYRVYAPPARFFCTASSTNRTDCFCSEVLAECQARVSSYAETGATTSPCAAAQTNTCPIE
jgi:hypothetical protein